MAIVPPTIEEVEADFDRLNALVLRNPSVVNFLDGCAATILMTKAVGLPTDLMIFAPGGRDWEVLGIGATCQSLLRDSPVARGST